MRWEQDKKRSDKFFPEITRILQDNAGYMVNIIIAPVERDVKQATDYLIKLKGGDVAVRLRWWSKYTVKKEWTVRSKRDSGTETELSKSQKGFAKWYLYGWVKDGVLASWMLLDLDTVRRKGVLDRVWDEKSNRDGTYFIIIPNHVLIETRCIISQHNI